MKHTLVDLDKFYTKDAPGIITGPDPGLRRFYIVYVGQLLKKKKKNVTEEPRLLLKLCLLFFHNLLALNFDILVFVFITDLY